MTILSAPSTYLPPIGKIQTYSAEDLTKAVRYLRLIYNPDVRGIRRVDRHRPQNNPTEFAASLKSGSHPSSDPIFEALRSDAFERAYAIRWLTALVSQVYKLLASADEDADEPAGTPSLEALLQQASALLAICAGTASAGTITRTFRFQNGDLGAGTGLVSVALGKLLDAEGGTGGSVVATDFHPSVLANLRDNIASNFHGLSSGSTSVSAHVLDWAKFPALDAPAAPFDEPFDLIFGADIIYEAEHAHWIKNCVEKLLRRPGRLPPAFHLIIPLRPTHTLESSTVEELFPSSGKGGPNGDLIILSKDIIVCEASGEVRSRSGAAQEVEYVHYVIGWCVCTLRYICEPGHIRIVDSRRDRGMPYVWVF
ncbi:uncharacterized protein B0H18DRAFT_955682 [Fomitopsis serialis]|uniref:uncharacterized protein n=1 Tax=Fomitopsis serialis TaxID=139415 RepID=UPI0020085D32|nr:uncharacterized protein B0H18DRAFT_955682 [Neoantrodia serialis]KAH9923829.1 hypothetical protein B0H18DRAFT_955682 [Neoantrodia serialis]